MLGLGGSRGSSSFFLGLLGGGSSLGLLGRSLGVLDGLLGLGGLVGLGDDDAGNSVGLAVELGDVTGQDQQLADLVGRLSANAEPVLGTLGVDATSSMTRPSRFLRESTTTTRYWAAWILPTRFRRIRTAT